MLLKLLLVVPLYLVLSSSYERCNCYLLQWVKITICQTLILQAGLVTARKSVKIHSLSKIMILHLKRFSYGSHGCTKLFKPIHFPLELVLSRDLLSSPSSEVIVCPIWFYSFPLKILSYLSFVSSLHFPLTEATMSWLCNYCVIAYAVGLSLHSKFMPPLWNHDHFLVSNMLLNLREIEASSNS